MKQRSAFANPILWGLIGCIILFIAVFGHFHGYISAGFALLTFAEVVLLFNILIIVHELGHFLVAKWCGLKIDKFAIWFGKPLWSKKVDGVEYIIGSIPAGGYVALPQMAPMEAVEGKSETPREELPPAAPGQKIIVAVAGPLFSFGLALVFATIVWAVGKPVSESEATTTIGYLAADMPAAKAGLQVGDQIISIDNHPITRFGGVGNSVMWRIMTSTDPTIPVVVKRGDQTISFDVTPKVEQHAFWQRSSPRRIGIGPAMETLIVKKVIPYSPAAMAGIGPKDQIVAFNGKHLYSDQPLFDQLKDHPNDPMHLTVLHDGVTREVTLTPEKPISPPTLPKDVPQTGIGIDSWEPAVTLVHPNPIEQVNESAQAVIGTLQALFTPHTTVGASQLSGPIGIMNILFMVLSSENGWRLALWFAVVINVNLAILNMFPFPILDGGHITLSVIEWIRKRPLSMAILEPLQTACALFLMGYMLYITFFDAQDSIKMASGGDDQQIKFAPKQSP